MTPGDVGQAYQRLLQCGASQPWPCPTGSWGEDGVFDLVDGRHQHLAAIMLGHRELLVAWAEER